MYPCHVLPLYPLVLIWEHSHITGFAPILSSTPYDPLAGDPPPVYPVASSVREAPSAFMQPLNQLMNTRLAALCTPLHAEGVTLFRVPYPLANPPTAPTMFMHSPNPHPTARDN